MSNKGFKKPAVLLALFSIFLIAGIAAADSYSLMIEVSPAGAGMVSPDGIYPASMDEAVMLMATPRPGYKFAYWLGDVSDVTANQTSIKADAPKIVVAVFERSEFEFEAEVAALHKGASGGSGLAGPGPSFGMGGGMMGGSYPTPDYDYDFPTFDEEENESDDLPVPEDGFPVPDDEEVPEPATMLLVGIGSMLIFRKRANS
jgi:hypothetical protein